MSASSDEEPLELSPERADEEVAQARKMARLWVWFCPGAGYAGVGWVLPALVSFVSWFGVVAASVWFIYTLDPLAGRVTAAGYGIGVAVWLVEIVCAWLPSSRAPAPRFLAHPPVVALVVAWALAGAWAVLILLNARSVVLAGGAMAPVADDGERFLYINRAEEQDLKRGAVILFRTPRGSGWQTDALTVGRIAAVPGDRIATAAGRLVVNGEPGPALGDPPPKFTRVVAVPAAPNVLVVPDNCYFVVSDNASVGFDTRVLGWAERDRVVTTRVWHLRRAKFLDRVE